LRGAACVPLAACIPPVYCLLQYDEYDNAAHCMMAHSPVAWEHVTFKDVVIKVSNVDVYYKAIRFYLQVSFRTVFLHPILSAGELCFPTSDAACIWVWGLTHVITCDCMRAGDTAT
jgi:hypothetical protein